MLTKWAKKLINLQRTNDYIFGYTGTAKGTVNAKDSAGTSIVIGPSTVTNSVALLTSITATGSGASAGIAIGSGDTAATENDHTIETLITTLTASATPTITTDYDTVTGKCVCKVDLTLSNATGADVTVKEVCRFTKLYKTTALGSDISTSAANGVCVLMDRTVLETPLVVAAGQSAILRYSFTYDMDKSA